MGRHTDNQFTITNDEKISPSGLRGLRTGRLQRRRHPDEFVQGDNTIAVFENDRLVFYDYDVFWEYSEPYTDPYGVTCIDLYMNKTRFVQNMPALDMEVPGIPIHPTPAGFEFDLRQAVPYYRGEPMPRYTLYDLEGELNGTLLEVEFSCIGYDVEYLGRF